MSYKHPEFCQKMQMKIANFLLQNIYITPNSCFQKAQTLIRKGKALRFCGIGGLQDCIQCLSEAIIIMVSCLVLLVSPSNILTSIFCIVFYIRDALAINMKSISAEGDFW
jgi:separase